MKKVIAKINEYLGLFFIKKYLVYVFKHKKSSSYLNERSIEYEFVLNNLLEFQGLDILDIGTGSNSFSSVLEHCGYNITATDLQVGSYWTNFNNRHIHVVKDDITKTKITKRFDAILCISVLEHIQNFHDAVQGMTNLLQDTGTLIMTFPYSHDTYCENVYKLDESDDLSKSFRYIGQSFSRHEINLFCEKNKLILVKTQFVKGWSGKFWRTGERYNIPVKVADISEANMGCFLFKKNNEA